MKKKTETGSNNQVIACISSASYVKKKGKKEKKNV